MMPSTWFIIVFLFFLYTVSLETPSGKATVLFLCCFLWMHDKVPGLPFNLSLIMCKLIKPSFETQDRCVNFVVNLGQDLFFITFVCFAAHFEICKQMKLQLLWINNIKTSATPAANLRFRISFSFKPKPEGMTKFYMSSVTLHNRWESFRWSPEHQDRPRRQPTALPVTSVLLWLLCVVECFLSPVARENRKTKTIQCWGRLTVVCSQKEKKKFFLFFVTHWVEEVGLCTQR